MSNIFGFVGALPTRRFVVGALCVTSLYLYVRAAKRIPDRENRAQASKSGFGLIPVEGFGSHPESDGLDLIFVHGLGSNPDTTWTAPNPNAADKMVCWITDWLPEDIPPEIQKNIRVFFYNHDTYWKRNSTQTRLSNLGRGLLNHISTVREKTQEQSRRLIFIGHSYGGLLIKEALIQAHNENTFSNIAANTKGILFLGTPHQGSDFAYWGTLIASALRPLGSNPSILRELRYDLTSLLDLHRHFVRGAGRNLHVINFFEEKEVSIFQLWGFSLWRAICVPESSATYELNSLTQSIALHVDHFGLNKFGTRDVNYRLIYHSLLRIIEDITILTLEDREDIQHPSHEETDQENQLQNGNTAPSQTLNADWHLALEHHENSLSAASERTVSILNSRIPLNDRRESTLSRFSNQDFTGRAEHLRKITALFRVSKLKDQRVVLWGLGGIGKSQIAFEYAQRHVNTRSTFWVKADTMEHFAVGFLAISRKLKPGFEIPKSVKEILSTTCELLESKEVHPWILVFDEVDHGIAKFRDYIPRTEHGQILLTTRDNRVIGLDQIVLATHGVNVSAMTIEEGVDLLEKKLPPQTLQNSTLTEQEKFIELLGGLPLAIIQAASYIREVPGTSIRSFHEKYQQIDEHDKLFGKSATSADLGQKSVLYTWEVSYEHIVGPPGSTSKSVAAQILDLLGFIDSKDTITRSLSEAEQSMQYIDEDAEVLSWLQAYLGPQSDPTDLIQKIWKRRIIGTGDTIEDFHGAIGMLNNYSLVTTRECWIHPIVHDWSYRRLLFNERHKYLEWIIAELLGQIDDRTPIEGSWWGYLNHRLDSPLHSLEDLSVLRNARTTLTLAMSPVMISFRQEHGLSIPDLVESLFLLGDRCFHLSRIDDAREYLDNCIVEAEADGSPHGKVILLHARLLRAKIQAVELTPHQTTELAQQLRETADGLFPSTSTEEGVYPDICLQISLWLAECLSSEGLNSDALQIIEDMLKSCSVSKLADYENFKPLIVGKLLAASILAEQNDNPSRSQAGEFLSEILRFTDLCTSDYVGLMLPTEAWKIQLQVANTEEERYEICRNMVSYEKSTDVWKNFRRFGGHPSEWMGFLEQLAAKEKWHEIEAFAKIYTSHQYPLLKIMKQRSEKLEERPELQQVIFYWVKMRALLGDVYMKLERVEQAEEQYAIAFMQVMILLPEKVEPPAREFRDIVYNWAKSLCYIIHSNDLQCNDPYNRLDLDPHPPPEFVLRRLRSSFAKIFEETEAEVRKGPLPIPYR